MPESQPDLHVRVHAIETKLDSLSASNDQRFEAVGQRLDRLEVAVEDIRDQVRSVAEGHAATQALLNRRFDELMARLDQRHNPIELAVRHHSSVLDHHRLTAGTDSL